MPRHAHYTPHGVIPAVLLPFADDLTIDEKSFRKHLADVTDLDRKCAHARRAALRRIAVTRAQAQARHAAGHLVGDVDGYLLEVAVTDALVEGLASPTIRTVAATCLVRTGRESIRRDI